MTTTTSTSVLRYATSTTYARRRQLREQREQRPPVVWVICPCCGYERASTRPCGLPCV